MNKSIYFPIIRSRDAELKGLSNISKTTLNKITPVVEITKSRRSKKNPEGDIGKSVSKIIEILEDQEFVADITSLKGQLNSQLIKLLDPSDGFVEWRRFVREVLPTTAIPTAHLTEPVPSDEFEQQVSGLLDIRDRLAVRIPTSYDYLPQFLEFAASKSIQPKTLLIIDTNFLPPNEEPAAYAKVAEWCNLIRAAGFEQTVVAGSSFPPSVTLPGYGKDEYGKFTLQEVLLSNKLKEKFGNELIIHGDYACIYPLEFVGTVTNWVPRVDVPLNTELFYHRYRREAGGYARAAKCALEDTDYIAINCWAHESIVAAAEESSLVGKNPAYWIAARLNYHIERQVKRLQQQMLR